jgi:hypothetical protein
MMNDEGWGGRQNSKGKIQKAKFKNGERGSVVPHGAGLQRKCSVVPHGAGLQLKARPGTNRQSSIVNRKWRVGLIENPKSKIENRESLSPVGDATHVAAFLAGGKVPKVFRSPENHRLPVGREGITHE